MSRRSIRHSSVAIPEPSPKKDEKAQQGDVRGVSEEDGTKAVVQDSNPIDDTKGEASDVAWDDTRGDTNFVKGDVASNSNQGEVEGAATMKDEVMEDGEGEGHRINAPISDGDAKKSGDAENSLEGDARLTPKEVGAGKGGSKKDQVMEDGDTNGDVQGAKIPRRKSPRIEEEVGSAEAEGAVMITSAKKSPAATRPENTPRRKSPRIQEVEVRAPYSKGTAIAASSAKKTSARKRPKRKAAEINQDKVSERGGAKNTPKRRKAERTQHMDDSYLPGDGWTKGSYIYNSNVNHPQHRRYSWVSPTEKIEFKYRFDAFTFESLRQKCGCDEIQAWIEYTKLKSSERKNREVIDPNGIDEQFNLDINMIRREDNPVDQIGPGWGLEKREGKSRSKRWRWISPTRGMKFRYRMDAQLFESLRQKYGEDEIQAWVEYSIIKHSERKAREVEDAATYDVGNITFIRKNHDNQFSDKTPGAGWTYGKLPRKSGKKQYVGVWISPTRKMNFRNRVDAIFFESLRKKHGRDEIKAWTEYTKYKHKKGVRREVVGSHTFDTENGIGIGVWTDEEHVQFVAGLTKFGKSYKNIAETIDTRSYSQVKSYGIRYFHAGGKMPGEPGFTPEFKFKSNRKPPAEPLPKHPLNNTKSRQSGKKQPRNKKIIGQKDSVTSSVSKKEGRMAKLDKEERSGAKVKNTKDSLREQNSDMIRRRVSLRNAPKEPPTTFDCLGHDDLRHIASYSSTIQDLASFTLTSKQTYLALSDNTPDQVYKSLFLAEYGELKYDDMGINWSWKELWARIHDLKKAFRLEGVSSIAETSVGVLRWEMEEAALFEDNPQIIAPVDREVSKGYVGLKALNSLPKPLNGKVDWGPPLLLHGDFGGIKIYDTAKGLLSGKRRAYLSLGEEYGQVTALAVCEFIEEKSPDSVARAAPCCFIGYESGVVAFLTAILSDDESYYHFSVEHHKHVHNSKVSSMTIVNCVSHDGHPGTVLLSACYGGQVFYYPNATNPEVNYDLTAVLAFSNSHPELCPILSMTSTTFVQNNKSLILVCTGDRDGSVRLWSASSDLLSNTKPSSSDYTFTQIKWYRSKGKHCVTITKFISPHLLVSGNNQGDIRVWNVQSVKESADSDAIVPGLALHFFLRSAHNGPVENVTNIGDVVITSGGNDGSFIGWDLTSGEKIGTVSCHYGQVTFDETTGEQGTVKSCVVGIQIGNGRLISLCRDGVLAEWVFGEENKTKSAIV